MKERECVVEREQRGRAVSAPGKVVVVDHNRQLVAAGGGRRDRHAGRVRVLCEAEGVPVARLTAELGHPRARLLVGPRIVVVQEECDERLLACADVAHLVQLDVRVVERRRLLDANEAQAVEPLNGGEERALHHGQREVRLQRVLVEGELGLPHLLRAVPPVPRLHLGKGQGLGVGSGLGLWGHR